METVTGPRAAEQPDQTLVPLDDTEVRRLRGDFTLLERSVNSVPLVYLDSGATSQKPQSVLDTEQHFYENFNAAVHRGAHSLAVEATDIYEEAREKTARFVGAETEEIVWTSNATEALNLLTYSFSNASAGRGGDAGRRFTLGPGDEILVTELEHHANLIPWQELAFRTGASLKYIPVDPEGSLRMDLAADLVGPRTRIVAFTHVSNVLGTVTDVAALVQLAATVGALTVLDGCQSVPHLPVDVKALDIDFMAFSGHKMLGPTGIGALYGRKALLDAMPPFLTGGSMITSVTMERAEFLPAPTRFEAGTQRISQAVALAAAIDYLDEVGMERIAGWEEYLGGRLSQGLASIPGIRQLGPATGPRIGAATIDVPGVHPHDVGQFLDSRGVAVRVGHHCAQPLHRALGVTASTRASTYLYNTAEDVDTFLNAVADVRGFFGVGA